MNQHQSKNDLPRRYLSHLTSFNMNYMHLRNPLIVAWWSAAFPGFGHLMLGKYLKGYMLLLWEVVINTFSKLNEAMVYSFTGQFDLARTSLNKRWLLLYIAVYIHSIWDSYRLTIETNKLTRLGRRAGSPIQSLEIGAYSINFLDKRNPLLAVAWSMLMPGLGHLYLHLIPTGFLLLCWTIIQVVMSHFLEAFYYTMTGSFREATAVIDAEWALFLPSLYGYAIYESYVTAVEYNNLFRREQAQHLRNEYQSESFDMPL
ncbi:hypothetical protein [Paenibacillus flagellatus]|uniref:DUF5683 domain-containing protein n=1 Tax=Paenibacillus flagellatus TaxID=2211139 RepID=A0A2V5K658_9BACL|nr:hypothetical protein [Paenibacillus flagellatus]PYI54865.1 hypothetical protein DLM86_09950 [Paenibacillus flagellatus]